MTPRADRSGRAERGALTETSAPRLAIVATTALTLRSFLLPYARHLRERGWLVHGIAADAESCGLSRAAFDAVHDVRWSRNPSDLGAAWSATRALRRLAATHRYDIVHVHTPVAAFVTRFALRRRGPAGPSVVYTAHGFHFHERGGAVRNAVFRSFERLAGRWTDRLVVINRDDEAAASAQHVVARARLRYMPGIGIDVASYRIPASENPYRALSAAADAPRVFLCIGEFNPGKRHADVVRALRELGRADAHLAFAGVGPLVETVRRLADELGVGGRVHFLGYRTDVPALLAHAAALILCSEREGLPRSVMEAMAAGTPVIGTDIRGIRDLVGSGAGILVPVGHVPAIAAGMRTILDEPARVGAMIDTARQRVDDYALERLLALHDSMYEELLAEARARSESSAPAT